MKATIEFLSFRLEWERGTLLALEWSLWELLDNVFAHSLANAGFFMFQIQQQRRKLSYCVADQGRGIFQSFLGSTYRPATPVDAITLAVRKGVTRNPQSNGGNGLWGTTEIISKAKGQITISSGEGAVYFNSTTATAKSIAKVKVLDRKRPGTYIDAQIDASVEVNVEDMFEPIAAAINYRIESLEDEDSGALRVRVKDFKFGAGTREAGELARIYTMNIYNESTSPVLIDFSDIGIVSSSFADEYIAKLYQGLGPEKFTARLHLTGLNHTNRVIIQHVLAQRIGLESEQATWTS